MLIISHHPPCRKSIPLMATSSTRLLHPRIRRGLLLCLGQFWLGGAWRWKFLSLWRRGRLEWISVVSVPRTPAGMLWHLLGRKFFRGHSLMLDALWLGTAHRARQSVAFLPPHRGIQRSQSRR